MDVASTSSASTTGLPRASTSLEGGLSPKVADLTLPQEIEVKSGELKRQSDVSNEVLSQQNLNDAVHGLNKQLQQLNSYLKFERDDSLRQMVIFIKDVETNEVVRQIPSEEFLKMAKAITSYLESAGQLDSKNVGSVFPKGWLTNETV